MKKFSSSIVFSLFTSMLLVFESFAQNPFPATQLTTRFSTSTGNPFNTNNCTTYSQDLRGQCTWYTAGRLIELKNAGHLNTSTVNSIINLLCSASGRHAKNWENIISGTWHSTASSALPPQYRIPGLIVVWDNDPSNSNSTLYGHVGFVEEINSNKTQYRVSEYNWCNSNCVTYSSTWLPFDGNDSRLGVYPKFYVVGNIDTTPSSPTLINPSNSQSNVSIPVSFDWNSVSGSSPEYRIQVATSQYGFNTGNICNSGLVVNKNVGNVTAFNWSSSSVDNNSVCSVPQPNTTYYWRVKVFVNGQSSEYSPERSFTTASIPASTPILISPSNGQTGLTNPINFTWNNSSNANEYRIQIIDSQYFANWLPTDGFNTATNCGNCAYDENIGNSTSFSWTGSQPGRTYYWTVRANGSGGASNFTNNRTFYSQVTVNPPSISASPTSICNGQSSTLSASNCAGTVNWNNNLGNGTSKTVYPTNSITYYATCTVNGTTSGNSNEATITVYQIPSAPTLSASPSTITSGQGSTLSATNCNGTVNWSNSLGSGTSKTVYPTSSTTYIATCTVNGCLSNSAGVTVNVNTTINPPSISASPTTICNGQASTLSASNCAGTVNWNNSLGNGTSKTVYPTNSITYYATCTVNGTTSGNSNEATVTVYQIPSAPVISTVIINSGQTATLTANGCTGTVTWFGANTGGNAIYTGNPFTTPTITSNSIYYADCTTNGCTNATRGSGTITITNPCPPTITHSNSANSGVYTASQSVNSTVNVPTNTSYFAGQSILLSPGFSAGPNENFIAKIQGCATVPTNGLIAYYPFNGNANNTVGTANNGVVSGAVLANDRFGSANRAYRFNDGNRITVTNNSGLDLPNAFTFNVWVNMLSKTGRDGNGNITDNSEQCIFTKNCDAGHLRTAIYPQANGTFLLQTFANNGDEIAIPFQLNQWKMISIVYDGTTLKQLVSGVVASTKTTTLNLALTNANDLVIGNMGCWIYYFNGILDDFRIYNRALSDAEVSQLYNAEKP